VKRRAKVVEVFCGPEALEKLVPKFDTAR